MVINVQCRNNTWSKKELSHIVPYLNWFYILYMNKWFEFFLNFIHVKEIYITSPYLEFLALSTFSHL